MFLCPPRPYAPVPTPLCSTPPAVLPPGGSRVCSAGGRCARIPPCWAAPVQALAQALGEHALRSHPELHTALQVRQQALQHVGAGQWVGEANLLQREVAAPAGARRPPADSDDSAGLCARWLRAPALRREEPHVQPAGCGARERVHGLGVGGASSPRLLTLPSKLCRTQRSSQPLPRKFWVLSPYQ